MRLILNRLATIWLLFVPLWMTWGAVTYSGLYRWLCEWQLSVNGEYDAFLTFVIPTLLLVAPTTLVLRLRHDAKPAVPPPHLEPAAAERLVIRVLCAIGLSGAIVCAGAWLWALQYPDRSGPSVDLDLAKLGDAIPPLGRVTLIGVIDTTHVVHKTIDAKGVGGRDLFAPMIERGAAHKPARIFVEEYVDIAVAQPLPTGVGSKYEGVLVKGGLPGDTLRQFARLNVGIADPYYLLLTGPDGARGNYYIIAGLGGVVALLGLLPLAVLFVSKVRRRRRLSQG
ncbi:MAG: hypothetical protein P4L98_20255 [Ancalomicrobiaceae bacterium]|nr:hypothetical protein [Ancalomicrobiaceae bacterium]